MDKIEKLLEKLSTKERARIKDTLKAIQECNVQHLDIKKLQGREDVFRARKGNMRIIFRKTNKEITILAVERRSDQTYR